MIEKTITVQTLSKRKRSMIGMMTSLKKGQELAERHPEIAYLYRDGMTLDKLAQKYVRNYEISPRVALNAIRYASIELLGEEAVRDIGKEHMHLYAPENGRRGGTITFEEGIGCFGMNKKKTRQARHKGGKIGGAIAGRKNYEAGVGIANLTEEEMRENGRNAAISRGERLYEAGKRKTRYGKMNEKSFIIYLKENEQLAWANITRKVNHIFRNNRSLETIRSTYNNRWRDN